MLADALLGTRFVEFAPGSCIGFGQPAPFPQKLRISFRQANLERPQEFALTALTHFTRGVIIDDSVDEKNTRIDVGVQRFEN